MPAIIGGQASQYGQTHFNMWAMLKALINNFVGIIPFNGIPVNGTSGTLAKKAGPGTIVIDVNTGFHYINIGTLLSPIWFNSSGPVAAGIAGGNTGGGLASVGNAKMTYNFAADGGAIATITPINSPTIPAGAIILGGVVDLTTAITSNGGNTATIGLGLGAGAQVASLLAPIVVSNAQWTPAGLKALIPVFTAASAVKVAAASRLTLTVAVQTLTAGVFDVNLAYVQGNV